MKKEEEKKGCDQSQKWDHNAAFDVRNSKVGKFLDERGLFILIVVLKLSYVVFREGCTFRFLDKGLRFC